MTKIARKIIETLNYRLIDEQINQIASPDFPTKYLQYHYDFHNDYYLGKTADVISNNANIQFKEINLENDIIKIPYIMNGTHEYIIINEIFYTPTQISKVSKYNLENLNVSLIILLAESSNVSVDDSECLATKEYIYNNDNIAMYTKEILEQLIVSSFDIKLYTELIKVKMTSQKNFNDLVMILSKISNKETIRYELNEMGLLQFNKKTFYEKGDYNFLRKASSYYNDFIGMVSKKRDTEKRGFTYRPSHYSDTLYEKFLEDIIDNVEIEGEYIYLKVTNEIVLEEINKVNKAKIFGEEFYGRRKTDTYIPIYYSLGYERKLRKEQMVWKPNQFTDEIINDEEVKEYNNKIDKDLLRRILEENIESVKTPIIEESTNGYKMTKNGKKLSTAMLLCFFLGIFGIHRFYDGRAKTGAIMLGITILSSYLLVIISFSWAIVDFIFYMKQRLK